MLIRYDPYIHLDASMELDEITARIADILKEFDSERPVFKNFRAGIGPYGEPQLVREISERLRAAGFDASTHRTPDLKLEEFALEFKIARPFGDNGKVAENWSVNLLHPYPGNTSAIGDVFKLKDYQESRRKAIFVIGFEHAPPVISLDPLIQAFEAVARQVCKFDIGKRIEENRYGLVHPVHQTLRCVSWEVR